MPPLPSLSKTTADWLQIFSSEPPTESDTAVITRLHQYFLTAIDHPVWRDWRANAAKDYQFREGSHWTPAELSELAERGQPPTVQNEVKPIIDRVHGQFLMTRQTTTFIGRNSPVDDPQANLQADLLRYTDQKSGYEFAESAVSLDGLTGGFGVMECGWQYDNDGYKCIYQRAENPFHMFPDPFSIEFDWSDAKYIQRAKWMDVEDAIVLWPDKESELRAFLHGHEFELHEALGIPSAVMNESNALYLDRARKRIRPVETWYKRKVKRYVIVTKDGAQSMTTAMPKEDVDRVLRKLPKGAYVSEPMYVNQMWLGVHVGALLIHHDQSFYKHSRFPFVPMFADRKRNGEPFGLARNIVPINEAINKRKSKALNMLSNRRIVAERGALEDPSKAAIENAKADGYIEVEPGALTNQKVLFPDNQDVGQAQVVLLQDDKASMPRVSGISDESLGMRTEVRSGAGIARKQMMTNLITNPVVNNLRRFRYERTKLVYDLMKEVYTEEMAFQVTDDPNSIRLIQLTKDSLAKFKEQTYDLVITDTPDYATVREQELDMVMQALPQVATYGPAWGKFILELTNLRNKKGLQAMLDQMSQPPAQTPKVALSMKWEELQPEEKAFFALQAFQDPQFAQALIGKDADPAFMAKIKAQLADTQIKEGTRAAVERNRVNLQAMTTAAEGMMQSRALHQTDRELDQYDRELDQTDREMQQGLQEMGGGDTNSL
jgi:hypothetical protein